MPLRVTFELNRTIASFEVARRFSKAFQRDLKLSLPAAVFMGYTPAGIIRFSQVAEKALQGKLFAVEVETRARVRLEELETLLRIPGLVAGIDRIIVERAESNNIDLVPMNPPQIKTRVMHLKDADLRRPAKTLRDVIANSLRSAVERLVHRVLPGDGFMLEAAIAGGGLTLTSVDQDLLSRTEILGFDPHASLPVHYKRVIRALFSPVQSDSLPHTRGKYLYDILEKLGFSTDQVNRIKIEGVLLVDDISFDLGTRRDVDRITVVAGSGEQRAFTASVDKETSGTGALTHNEEEFKVLLALQQRVPSVSVVQKLYGLYVEHSGTFKKRHDTVSFKEYLEGLALGLFYESLSPEQQNLVVRKVGRMLGTLYMQAGVFPGDLNPLNIIVDEKETGITCRLCDLSYVEREEGRITAGLIPAVLRDYPGREEALLTGFVEMGGLGAQAILRRLQTNPVLSSSVRKVLDRLQAGVRSGVRPKAD